MNPTFTPCNTTATNFAMPLRRLMILFAGIIFFALNSFGQIGVTVTNPGNTTPALAGSYTSLGGALTALNATTAMSGPVTFTLASGSEPAPATGFVIGSSTLNPVLSSSNSVTIIGAGASTIINAGVGTVLPTGNVHDGIIKLVGADWITIDGLTLIDGNASGNAMMEFGIGLYKASGTDGCNNNTIRNCNITLNKLNNATASLTASHYGSKGIVIANATDVAMNTPLTITAASGTSSNNKFYNNTIQNCHSGIVMISASSSTPFTTSDFGNDVGGSSGATGNTIRNFGSTGATLYSAGVYAINQKNYNISYNNIDNNDGSGQNHPVALYGIYSNTSTSANVTIINNTIKVVGAGTTSSHNVTAIENAAGSTAASNTVEISNNVIQNSGINNITGSAAFRGIVSSGSAANVNVSNNNVSNNTSVGTSGGSMISVSAGTTVTISGNNVNSNTFNHAAGTANGIIVSGGTNINVTSNNVNSNIIDQTTGTFQGLVVSAGTTINVTSNNLNNNTTAATSGTVNLLYVSASTSTTVVNTNTATGNIMNSSGAASLYLLRGAAGSMTFDNNTVSGNGVNTSSTGRIYGIYNISSPSTGIYTNNVVSDLWVNSSNITSTTHEVFGFNLAQGANGVVAGNTINNLRTMGTVGGGGVWGLSHLAGTLANVSKNKIYNLSSIGSQGRTLGMNTYSGTNIYIHNNMIGDLRAPDAASVNGAPTNANASGNPGIFGILIYSGNNIYLYNNTVYLNATSTAPEFHTSTVFSTLTPLLVEMRNNILVNHSNPGALGTAAVLWRSGADMSNYSTASNNNLFNAGIPSANNLIFRATGSSGDQTLLDFKARVAPADGLSVKESPTFITTNSALPGFLHIDPTVPTQVESGGAPIGMITDDIDGDPRNATTPDIGADEFDGTPADVVTINTISTNPPGNLCVATGRTVTANITAGTEDITSVTLFYSVNGGSQTQVTMTGGTSTAGTTSNWIASIPIPTPATATITWGVSAIDPSTSRILEGTPYADEPLSGGSVEIEAVPNPVCSGSQAVLTAKVKVPLQPVTIGNGASTSITYSSPFYSNFGNKRIQMLFTAAELESWGLAGGAINALTFYINTIDGTDLNQDFSVKLGHTNATSLADFVTTPLQPVFSTGTFSPNVGACTINFTAPFTYDGESALVVEICFGNSGSTATISGGSDMDATPFVSTRMWYTNAVTSGSTICSTPGSTTTGYSTRARVTFNGSKYRPMASHVWNDGTSDFSTVNPVNVNPLNNTTYTYTGTDANGCVITSDPYTLVTTALPATPIGSGVTQCGEGVPTAFAVSSIGGDGSNFRWYDAPTGGNLVQTGGSTFAQSISETTSWWVSEMQGVCESGRVLVTATVNQPDPLTAQVSAAEICIGETVNLSVSQDGNDQDYSFTWTATPEAGSGITGSQTGAPVTGALSITPTAIGTYTYALAAVDGACNASSSVNLLVKHLPTIASITATPNGFCVGETSGLAIVINDAVSRLDSIGSIGTGANTSTTSSPFSGASANRKSQIIILGSELIASGYLPGPITAFGVNVTNTGTLGPIPLTVSMGHTTASAATTTFLTGLTQVFSGSYTPVTGVSVVDFTTPFIWNGIDNIVIESCHTGNVTTGKVSASVNFQNTTPSRVTNSTTTGCAQLTGTTSAARPIVFLKGILTTITSADHNIVWNPGALVGDSVDVTPTATTLYEVTATNPVTGCSASGSINVIVDQLPPAPTASNSDQCGNVIPTASVSSTSGLPTPIFNWYDVATGGTPVQTGPQTTWQQPVSVTTVWYVSEISPNGCEGPRVELTAAVVDADPITASASVNNVCPGVSITLEATQLGFNNTYEYTWLANSPGSGLPNDVPGNPITITPTESGVYTYNVSAYDVFAGCISNATVVVTIEPIPLISRITASPDTSCTGDPVVLEVFSQNGPLAQYNITTETPGSFTGAANPYWRGVSTIAEAHKIQFVYRKDSLNVQGMTGAQLISGLSFFINENTSPSTYKNFTISLGHTNLNTLASNAFQGGLQVVKNAFDHTPGTGEINYMFDNQFSWDGTSNIIVQVCYDNDVDNTCLNCNTGVTVAIKTKPITGTGNTSATYYYESNAQHPGGIRNICGYTGGGSGSSGTGAAIPVTKFYTEPTNNAQQYNWTWSPGGQTTSQITVNPTTTTTYTVTGVNVVTGCVNSGTIEAAVRQLPAAPVAANSTHCGPQVPTASVSTGGANGTFIWYDAETGGTILQSGGSTYTSVVSQTTTLWVSEFDGNCYSPRTPVTITVVQRDPVSATTSQPTVCTGANFTLTAVQTGSNQNYVYTWSAIPEAGSGLTNGTAGGVQSITPTAVGSYTYYLTAIDNTAPICEESASVSVTVKPVPVITDFVANPPAICFGQTTELTALSQNIVPFAQQVVLGDSAAQLGASTGNPYRTGTSTPIKTQFLIRASELHNAGIMEGSFSSLGFNTNATAGSFSSFEIRMGHTASTALTSTFQTVPMTTVFATGGFAPPANTITSHEFSTPFFWDDTSNIVIEIRTVSDVTGTSNTASFNAGFLASLQATGASSLTATTGSTSSSRPLIYLNGFTGADVTSTLNWTWNPGNLSGSTVTVSPATTTTYTVSVVDPSTGCAGITNEEVVVTVNELPPAVVANNSVQCGLGIPTASVTGGGGTYNWYDAATGGNLLQTGSSNTYSSSISTTTTFYVAEYNGTCESLRTPVTVTVNDPDPVSAGVNDNSVCPNDAIILSAVNIAVSPTNTYTYVWTASPEAGSGITGSASGSSISVNPTAAGTYVYTVVASDAGAECTTLATVSVTVNEVPVISNAYATNPAFCEGGNTNLVAESFTIPGSATIGTQTTTSTTGAPFRGSVANSRQQYLILASELTGAGIPAGLLTGITFNVTSTTGPYDPIENFKISMGTTVSVGSSRVDLQACKLEYSIVSPK